MQYQFFSNSILIYVLLTCFGACSTSMTNLADPHALAPGHVEVTIAGQASADSVIITKGIDGAAAAQRLAQTDASSASLQNTLGDDDRLLLDSALAVALFAPSAEPELMLRVGVPAWIFAGVDLGVRLSTSVLKLDAKLQLLGDAEDPQAVALHFAYGWQHSGLAKDLEWVMLSEYERSDFEMLLSYGYRVRDLMEFYCGPRVMLSSLKFERKLEASLIDLLPEELAKYDPSRQFQDEWMLMPGASLGLKLGYKYVFVRLELNAFYAFFAPTILGQKRNFDGLVLAPSIALSGTW